MALKREVEVSVDCGVEGVCGGGGRGVCVRGGGLWGWDGRGGV